MSKLKKSLGLLLVIAILATLLCPAFAQDTSPAPQTSQKYQIFNYTLAIGEPATIVVIVDSAMTKYSISYTFAGNKVSASGAIKDGKYILDNAVGSVADDFDGIVAAITDKWGDVPADTGKTNTITFNSNYDKQADTTLKLSSSTPISGAALKRFGYSFSGWYYDKEATKPVVQNPFVTADTTVYAGWVKWDQAATELMELYKKTMAQAQYIMAREPAYEQASFDAFYQIAFTNFLAVGAGGMVFNQENAGLLYGMIGAMEKLVKTGDPKDYSWEIWGDEMATEPGADKYEFFGFLDDESFRPILVPYMLEDQAKVKGNIVLVSGGAFFLRSNIEEAYPSAKAFNDLGYNCFVLQRRVLPYAPIDSGLDLARAIRFLKYNAKDLGIAQIDNIAAAGFSGGGGTISFYAENFYGGITPDTLYPSYKPDAIDKVNSDIDAILMIYSGGDASRTTNPNWPATFIVAGTDDTMVSAEKSLPLYTSAMKLNSATELHLFANAPHGFGAGTGVKGYMGEQSWVKGYSGAGQWIPLADTFLEQVFGLTEPTYEYKD